MLPVWTQVSPPLLGVAAARVLSTCSGLARSQRERARECVEEISEGSRHSHVSVQRLQPLQQDVAWACPANDLGLHRLGRAVLQKPLWFNDLATGFVNASGCQIGATCGLLALSHVLRGLGTDSAPLTLQRYRAHSGDYDSENFDLLNLLSFADAHGVSSEPLPSSKPRCAYLLHSPGHYVALVYTRIGTLLCDCLHPRPFILTADESMQILHLFSAMQQRTAHVDFANRDRMGGWMGMCLWKR